MGRRVNRKCQQCATLAAEAAMALHGPKGDNCWNPRDERGLGYDCHRRRNHYRHRQAVNAERRLERRKAQKPLAPVSPSPEGASSREGRSPLTLIAPPPETLAAVLVLYRQTSDSPVHAVAAEVWQGDRKFAGIQPVHCMGLRGDQLSEYIREMLQQLHQHFGLGRFEDVIKELPVHRCPIRPCPYQEG
jgi:hypothetical protein